MSKARAFIVKSRTRGHVVKEFKCVVDHADACLLRSHFHSANVDRNGNVYIMGQYGAGVWLPLTKRILGIGEESFVEHINGNTLDCRRINLKPHPMSEKGDYAQQKVNASQVSGA